MLLGGQIVFYFEPLPGVPCLFELEDAGSLTRTSRV